MSLVSTTTPRRAASTAQGAIFPVGIVGLRISIIIPIAIPVVAAVIVLAGPPEAVTGAITSNNGTGNSPDASTNGSALARATGDHFTGNGTCGGSGGSTIKGVTLGGTGGGASCAEEAKTGGGDHQGFHGLSFQKGG